jgi:hypothetical protein
VQLFYPYSDPPDAAKPWPNPLRLHVISSDVPRALGDSARKVENASQILVERYTSTRVTSALCVGGRELLLSPVTSP